MGHDFKTKKLLSYEMPGVIVVASCLLLFLGSALFLQTGCQEKTTVEERPALQKKGRVTAPGEIAVTPSDSSKREAETAPEKPAGITTKVGEPVPSISFEKVVHDFGDIAPANKYDCEFKFTNTGNGLLKITNVKECCGVKTELSKREYKPGESGILKVRLSSPSYDGSFSRQIHVSSNQWFDEKVEPDLLYKKNPRITLTLKGRIAPKIECKPTNMKLLLEKENADCPDITITSLDNKPFSIKGLTSTGNSITADFDPSVKATEFVLKPKVDIDKLSRYERGYIRISLDHPESNSVNVSFSVLPKFTSNPPQIILLGAKPGQTVVRKIWVLNNYGEDFEIESAYSKKNIIKVLNQTEVSSGYQFEVEITPPELENKRTLFTDVFIVKIKGDEELAINCRGFYLSAKHFGSGGGDN